MEKKVDAKGIEVSYEYDALGRVTKESTKSQSGDTALQTTYSYKLNNSTYGGYGTSALVIQKPNGYSGYTVYDSLGRELKLYSQNISGNEYSILKSYVYGVTGQKVLETVYNEDAKGTPYQFNINYKYDALGRETAVTSPSGETKVTTYNDVERSQESYVKTADGMLSPKSVVTFNEMKKPVKVVLYKPDGSRFSESSSQYDGFGNIIGTVDVNGNKMAYSYSAIGQKLEEKYPDGRRISYEYDLLFPNQVTKKSVILSNGKSLVLGTREYNVMGQMVLDSDPSGKTIKYSYDSKGNISHQILRSGKEIQYTYNGFNKVLKKEVVGEGAKYSSTYEYDPATQNLLSMTDATGITGYKYNLDGSLRSVTYPDNNKITYKYDLQGHPIGLTDVAGSQTVYHFSHTNGKLEKTEFITNKDGSQVELYSYDGFGRISKKTMPNKAETRYAYNEMGNLENLSHHMESGSTILAYSYTYNIDLNIASRIRLGSGGIGSSAEEQYKYDALNNLSEYRCSGVYCPKDQNGSSIASEEYTFDGLNNIKTAKVGFVGGESSLTTYNYSDKDPSRLIGYSLVSAKGTQESTLEYDADGNVTKDGEGNILTYTPFNRLATFVKGGKLTEYNYNGSGNLVSQRDVESNKLTKYYYNGKRVISESDNGTTVSYFQVSGRVVGKSSAASGVQFFLTDQAQSVIRVMEGSNLLKQNYAYTPYGQQTDLSQPSPSSSKESGFGFNGERTDGKTGYQFLGKGYRAYNPALGRFMQYDSFSPFGKGGINGYTFAENNPIMKFDPSGESATSSAMMGVGIGLAIIGIIASVVTFGVAATAAVPLTATQFALATTSLVTGVASGATGIAGAVYEHKASVAAESGNKELAASLSKTASDLGWASLALGIVSTVSGIASNFGGVSKELQRLNKHEQMLRERNILWNEKNPLYKSPITRYENPMYNSIAYDLPLTRSSSMPNIHLQEFSAQPAFMEAEELFVGMSSKGENILKNLNKGNQYQTVFIDEMDDNLTDHSLIKTLYGYGAGGGLRPYKPIF